jgi:hypothetical protein
MRTGILIYDAVLLALVVAVVWGRRNRAKYALWPGWVKISLWALLVLSVAKLLYDLRRI